MLFFPTLQIRAPLPLPKPAFVLTEQFASFGGMFRDSLSFSLSSSCFLPPTAPSHFPLPPRRFWGEESIGAAAITLMRSDRLLTREKGKWREEESESEGRSDITCMQGVPSEASTV